MIPQYSRVKLKTGEMGSVVEVWEDGVAYEVDVDVAPFEYETRTVRHEEIASVFIVTEVPVM